MKKIVLLLLMFCAFQMHGQDLKTFETDHKVALEKAESENKPIFVFVTNNEVSQEITDWQNKLLSSDALKSMSSQLIFLKLDVSDKKSTNFRYGSHYIKSKIGYGFALVGADNNTIGEPLYQMDSQNTKNFLDFIKTKI